MYSTVDFLKSIACIIKSVAVIGSATLRTFLFSKPYKSNVLCFLFQATKCNTECSQKIILKPQKINK